MLQKALNNAIEFLEGLKKESEKYPPEFGIVIYNKNAVNNGIEDNANKLIVRYKYNKKIDRLEVFQVKGYSDSLFHTLKYKLKIPMHDSTIKEIKFPIYSEIKLDELRYIK